MGINQSNTNIDFEKKLYIVFDLYVTPKSANKPNYNIHSLKVDSSLKKHVKDIIISSIKRSNNYNVSITDSNLLLICKLDKNNISYFEVNSVIEFVDVIRNKGKTDVILSVMPGYIHPNQLLSYEQSNITTEMIKMNIINKLYSYISNKYGIITSDITVIISNETLQNLHIFQK